MPIHTKPHLLKKYLNRVFVETGTEKGAGVMMALEAGFDQILSMEVNPEFHRQSMERFRHNPKVRLFVGNSGQLMGDVIKNINEPITFWLDAHGETNGTPILAELETIAAHPVKTHTILVDDMRIYRERSTWARISQVSEDDVLRAVKGINPDYEIGYEDDQWDSRDILVARVQAVAKEG